ncbi:NUDIX hydrolase domain-like protein [Filobasidium floriforme]|uniref:NUDIX hydrolase domain-like protein n=1 Tax=Filobasidium floriforme TaxID=5210 RepID=UPI001E8E5782|nr:NUDIX hydrolase domain-like protein [Filobasidium floriforme]KAH8090619.1 NUDIX hydrolase domain-like protein [Filobasidium floriforme]
MSASPFLQAVRRADNLQVPTTDLVSNVLQSPSDQTGPTSLRPWSIPLHLARADMQAGLTPIGWLRPAVRAFLEYHWPEGDLGEPMIEFGICRELAKEGTVGNCHQDGPEFAFVSQRLLDQGYEGLTREMNRLARYMKDKGMYSECLDGWRDEHYEIFASPKSSYFASGGSGVSSSGATNRAFDFERAACAVFGLATFGVHMTAYEGEGEEMKIWVPKRSATKATWPSKLDNSVAGGIPAGMVPFESMIKECEEEASLPESLTRKLVRPAGFVSYFHVTEEGWFQPEYEYVYDLKMPARESPEYQSLKPFDDEVDSFQLLPVREVIDTLQNDPTAFKPNCGLIIVDFLIRHGMITVENEPDFFEIGWSCHKDLGKIVPFPVRRR